MPLSFSHLKNNTRTLEVPYDGDKVNLTYRPGEITPALSQEMVSEETKEPAVLALGRALVQWDVVEKEGDTEPMPCDADTLRGFSAHFLNSLLRALYEDSVPGKR